MGRISSANNVAQLFETIGPRETPADLRIAEAMLFASAEPLDESALSLIHI